MRRTKGTALAEKLLKNPAPLAQLEKVKGLDREEQISRLNKAMVDGELSQTAINEVLGARRVLVGTALVNGQSVELHRTRREERGALGSHIEEFDEVLRGMVLGTTRVHLDSPDFLPKHIIASWAALKGIGAKSELEGMFAGQLVATHEAAMACFQMAAAPGQRGEIRERELSQANRLVRSYATLVAALDKHRGKGQQTVRVEHVHVHDGGQAIVGNVSHGHRSQEESAADAIVGPGVSET